MCLSSTNSHLRFVLCVYLSLLIFSSVMCFYMYYVLLRCCSCSWKDVNVLCLPLCLSVLVLKCFLYLPFLLMWLICVVFLSLFPYVFFHWNELFASHVLIPCRSLTPLYRSHVLLWALLYGGVEHLGWDPCSPIQVWYPDMT